MNLLNDSLYIRAVDHRISTAIVFSLILLMLRSRHRRPGFPARAGMFLAVSCAASWALRYATDHFTSGPIGQGVGSALHILVMCMLFGAGVAFCFEAKPARLAYVMMLALTVFKLAWNIFKVCGNALSMVGMEPFWSTYSAMGSLVSYAVYATVCFFACNFFYTFVERMPADAPVAPMFATCAAFVFCQMVLEFCGHVFTTGASTVFLYHLCALMYTLTSYIVLINLGQLYQYRRANEDMQNFIHNKMQYYQMSRDGITSLQIKCHDLKHQIAAMRTEEGKASLDKYIARLEDSLIEYGTVVECGNETINVVLTEKNILCAGCGVKFSYIIDGTLFDFMSEMEIYSLFGNALDNALESCMKLSAPEKRVISLKAAARGEMVVLHVENYYDEQPVLVDGMPVTTKDGSGHGFGLRSIREIAGKYGGIASVQAENHIFKLTVVMYPKQ